MLQRVIESEKLESDLLEIINHGKIRNVFLVHTNSFKKQKIYWRLKEVLQNRHVVEFTEFSPNPAYESVKAGVELFQNEQCEFIIAAGGGSAIDVAKCIKLFADMEQNVDYLLQTINDNRIPLLAIPTTAGTGSEATQFAVIYTNNKKMSVAHKSCIPDYVIFDPSVLTSLPIYHRKATMFDALCHAIESFWSIHSTEESKAFSTEAIILIMKYKDLYLSNDAAGNAALLKAANLAGKAINITLTTAGHAMCYSLTGLFGIAHGHAAALCVSKLWPFMVERVGRCIDSRGSQYLSFIFHELDNIMGDGKEVFAVEIFADMISNYQMDFSGSTDTEKLDILCESVNEERLKNNPVCLSKDDIRLLYGQILKLDSEKKSEK